MAQDFYHHFGTDKHGTIGSDTLIATADFDGVSFAAIKALEARSTQLKIEKLLANDVTTLEKIANVLNVDIDSFFYEANNFITDGTDLKLLIGLYKELLTEILEENPALVNRERRIKQFESYNKLVDLNKFNWIRTKWG